MTIDFKALAAPFPPSAVSWRVGSVSGERGMALAYLDARDVADRLDAVCTPQGWACRYSHVGAITVCDIGVCVMPPAYNMGGLAGTASVGIPAEWVWKADGAGQSDIEAEKGALSDAFKRAAVRWGIGRYLYHLPSPWVEIEKRGRTSVIKESEYAKLERILSQAGTPPSRPTLPPADQDVTDAAERWFRSEKLFLENCTLNEDVTGWEKRQVKALAKLKLQHRPMWDLLEGTRKATRERLGMAL